MLDWITCIQTFNKIVESGSFTKTARKLHTTPSAISKRVSWLEEMMGIPLFRRSTRQVNLTEAGSALYERSVPLLNEWQEIKQAVSTQHEEPTGVLQLGVPIGFGNQYIVSMLPKFLEQYPKIKVDLKLSNCVTQLANEQIDLFVCYENKIQNKKDLHAQVITTTCHKLYAAPSYLKKHGEPKTISDLTKHNCLKLNCEGINSVWEFEDEQIPVSGNLITNNTNATITAAIAGIGIMRMCPILIEEELKNGQLIPLLTEYSMNKRSLHAFYPKQKFVPKKTLAFLEHMKKYFEEGSDAATSKAATDPARAQV